MGPEVRVMLCYLVQGAITIVNQRHILYNPDSFSLTFVEYVFLLMISGAIQYGVPAKVFLIRLPATFAAKPKSVRKTKNQTKKITQPTKRTTNP